MAKSRRQRKRTKRKKPAFDLGFSRPAFDSSLDAALVAADSTAESLRDKISASIAAPLADVTTTAKLMQGRIRAGLSAPIEQAADVQQQLTKPIFTGLAGLFAGVGEAAGPLSGLIGPPVQRPGPALVGPPAGPGPGSTKPIATLPPGQIGPPAGPGPDVIGPPGPLPPGEIGPPAGPGPGLVPPPGRVAPGVTVPLPDGTLPPGPAIPQPIGGPATVTIESVAGKQTVANQCTPQSISFAADNPRPGIFADPLLTIPLQGVTTGDLAAASPFRGIMPGFRRAWTNFVVGKGSVQSTNSDGRCVSAWQVPVGAVAGAGTDAVGPPVGAPGPSPASPLGELLGRDGCLRVKLCDGTEPPPTPEPTPEPETTPPDCRVIYDPDACVFYLSRIREPLRKENDIEVVTGDTERGAIERILADHPCGDETPGPEPKPEPFILPPGVISRISGLPAAREAIQQCGDLPISRFVRAPNPGDLFSRLLDETIRNSNGRVSGTVRETFGRIAESLGLGPFADPLLKVGESLTEGLSTSLVGGLVGSFFEPAKRLLDYVVNNLDCTSPGATDAAGTLALLGVAERWVTNIPPNVTQPIQQRLNFLCPYSVPPPQSAAAAWLADEIDDETLRCWVRSAGFLWPEFARTVEASRSKLSAGELTALWRRKLIDRGELKDQVRKLGFIRDEDVAFERLSEAVPPIPDLIRMMVRDVADNNIVQRFGLDTDFGKKWTGRVKEWGEFQGISDEFARMEWRAHWEIPSPTQLFTMFQRLRNLPAGDPAHVSAADIRTALEQQDIPPFWIDKFLALTFRPIPLRNLRQAFSSGAIDESGLTDGLKALGFGDQPAADLTEAEVRRKQISFRSHWAVKAAIDAEVSIEQALAELEGDGATQFDLTVLGDWIRVQADLKTKQICIPQISRQFLSGQIDQQSLADRLHGLGLSTQQVTLLETRLACQQKTADRDLSKAEILRLLSEGIIDESEAVQRLRNLGFDSVDAQLLLRDLGFRRDAKEQRDAERARNREAARLRRLEARARREAGTARRTEAERERAARQAARAREKAARNRAKREDQRIETARRISARSGTEFGVTLRFVRSRLGVLRRETGIGDDRLHKLAVIVSQIPAADSVEAWETLLDAAIESRPEVQQQIDQIGTAAETDQPNTETTVKS